MNSVLTAVFIILQGKVRFCQIGNVFYEHGIITITNTGSSYANIGLQSGADGWSVRFQSTKTSYEYQYLCNVGEYQFTGTTNPSAVVGRSGSVFIPENASSTEPVNGAIGADEDSNDNTLETVLTSVASVWSFSFEKYE